MNPQLAAGGGSASPSSTHPRPGSTPPRPESVGSQGGGSGQMAGGTNGAAAITPELIQILQELLQKAQQPGADQGQITQAVMQQLQQQLPPELVMSVLQQASGLQVPQTMPNPTHHPASGLAQGPSAAGYPAPSPGPFSQSPRPGTSPLGYQSPLTQHSPTWNGMATASQPFGSNRMQQMGNGLPRTPQLSPADMMMRLQLENQQRTGLAPGMNRSQGFMGAGPNHMQAQPAFPRAAIPNGSAGLLAGMSSAQLGPSQLAGLLRGQQARAMRPEVSQQLLQMQVSSPTS